MAPRRRESPNLRFRSTSVLHLLKDKDLDCVKGNPLDGDPSPSRTGPNRAVPFGWKRVRSSHLLDFALFTCLQCHLITETEGSQSIPSGPNLLTILNPRAARKAIEEERQSEGTKRKTPEEPRRAPLHPPADYPPDSPAQGTDKHHELPLHNNVLSLVPKCDVHRPRRAGAADTPHRPSCRPAHSHVKQTDLPNDCHAPSLGPTRTETRFLPPVSGGVPHRGRPTCEGRGGSALRCQL